MPAIDPMHAYLALATFEPALFRDAPSAASIERALASSAGTLGTRIGPRARITCADQTGGRTVSVIAAWRTRTPDALAEELKRRLDADRSGWTVVVRPFAPATDGTLEGWASGDYTRTTTRDGCQAGRSEPALPGDHAPATLGGRLMDAVAAAGQGLGQGLGGALAGAVGGVGGGIASGLGATVQGLMQPVVLLLGAAYFLRKEIGVSFNPSSYRKKAKAK